jgi:YedE family putative selenium metabolism protein
VDKKNFMISGAVIGIGAVLLSYYGNPPNTGICISCFMRNVAGAIGLHDNIRLQYLRPEILAIVVGAFFTSLLTREFKATSGSSPILRFFIGIFLIVGCSVFIGCPIKMVLRIAAGDLSAIVGIFGLFMGVWAGLQFLERGFRLGMAHDVPRANGLIIPILMSVLLILLLLKAPFVNFSIKGSAALHAPVWMSLFIGLLIGSIAQVTGFCITGGVSRLLLWGPKEVYGCPKSTGLLIAIGSLFITAMIANFMTGQFNPGLHGQPSSNEDYLWNGLGMGLVGFGSVLIKGCPLRQLVLSGQGDSDASAAVLGMLVGAAVVQNWGIAGTAEGTPLWGKIAVVSGFIILLLVGLLYRERDKGLAPEYQLGLD